MSFTSNIKVYPTLNGIFSVPKVQHRRDFLRENKLSLRDLEKETSKKLAAKQPIRPKWMPPEPVARSTTQLRSDSVPKRSTSQCRPSSRCKSPLPVNSYKQKGEKELQLQQQHKQQQQQLQREQSQQSITSRCQSCGSQRNVAVPSCDRAVQTEEISDKIYLTHALRKLSSSIDEGVNGSTGVSDGGGDADNHSIISRCPSNKSRYAQRSIVRDGTDFKDEDTYHENKSKISGYKDYSADTDNNDIELSQYIEKLDLQPECPNYNNYDVENNDEQPLSARSRQTVRSNYTVASISTKATTKSKKRPHQLGSKDDVRLPRYLEREKREKEEKRQHMVEQDPDCPYGHVLLNEEERLSRLTAARLKFDTLVNELNRLPMTTQTLRVRNRKAEIDKELTIIENNIRILSKPKVYVQMA